MNVAPHTCIDDTIRQTSANDEPFRHVIDRRSIEQGCGTRFSKVTCRDHLRTTTNPIENTLERNKGGDLIRSR